MEITKFVITGRDQALLYGDYSTYRAQLSRKLLALRKKLGRTTKKNAKYTNKSGVTAEDIVSSNEFVHLLLFMSERAWAHAMSMKASHAADTKGISGSTRTHIISRLHKAVKTAQSLLEVLKDPSVSVGDNKMILEAHAYVTSLRGAEEFEKQSWEACVKSYSIAWIIYSTLATSTKSDTFKDLLSSAIEPSIRYAAYQIRIPRTVAIPTIARKYFPRSDTELLSLVAAVDSCALSGTSKVKAESAESEATSRTIKWRTRTVELEDASVAVALESVASATQALSEKLSLLSVDHPKERAAAYDGVLIASQDVVDATKHAIDEFVAEGIGQGDKRVQSLQITRTAVSYDMISWRIGRNRVLTGRNDGALLDSGAIAKPRRSKKAKGDSMPAQKEEGVGRRLSRLREKVVLYDLTLQSLDSIRELPGVAADTALLHELEAKYNYFRALKCLAISRSHSLLSEHKNALALLARASDMIFKTLSVLSSVPDASEAAPTNISVSLSEAHFLSDLLRGELERHRALVELANLSSKPDSHDSSASDLPLVEKLDTYATEGVDLTNLVTYPPRLEPIPVKPLFFDVAWNYIEYPGRTHPKETENIPKAKLQSEKPQEQTAQQKKGWFGFGR